MISLFPPVPDPAFTPNINVSGMNTADNANWSETYLNASQLPSAAIIWVSYEYLSFNAAQIMIKKI
jgi:hypothetical protein